MAANTATAQSGNFFPSSDPLLDKDILTPSPWAGSLHELESSNPLLVPCLKQAASPRAKSHGTVMFASTATLTIPPNHASTIKLTGSETKVSAVSAPRTKTSFQLAYPPPSGNSVIGRQRLRVRPRVLLQLHHISASTRPTPALDVLPAIAFAPVLARKFPTILKEKTGLGPNDLVVVSSEEYNTSVVGKTDKSKDLDDGGSEAQEVVATICQLPKDDAGSHGKAEICLGQGPAWLAKSMPNGCYDFVAVNDEGQQTTVRWVPRVGPSRRRSTSSQGSSAAAPRERKFNFSIINAATRRHPVIATLTCGALDILDKYPSLSASSAGYPPSSLNQVSPSADTEKPISESPETHGPTMIDTEDSLRSLIVVTGVWIAFQENWSRSIIFDDHSASLLSSPPVSPTPRRCVSMRARRGAKSSTNSSDSQSLHLVSLSSEPNRVVHTRFDKLQRAPASASSVPQPNGRIELSGLHPRRANSTGSALIQRANKRTGPDTFKTSHRDPLMLVKEGDGKDNSTTTVIRGGKVATIAHKSATLMSLGDGMLQEKAEATHRSPLDVKLDLEGSESWTPLGERKRSLVKEVGIHRGGPSELPENRRWGKIKGLFHIHKSKGNIC
ncbi:MAG: hypothetical protein M1836_002575 [Candelina mexicana]|nr:MAG: hypothetical protein M1836_002575 [Candelina mexicana]